MKNKPFILSTLAYTLVTFPLAVIWHIVLFESLYRSFNYFGENPNFILGFSSIFIQGAVLSYVFPIVVRENRSWKNGLKFGAVAGLFHWTIHVLAAAAKNEAAANLHFFAMETFYLALQFGLFGLLVGLIYSRCAKEQV